VRSGAVAPEDVAALEQDELVASERIAPLGALLAERAALAAVYTEEWPELRSLDAEVAGRLANLERLLAARVERDQRLADDLNTIVAGLQRELGGLPEAEVELLRHRRRVEAFERIYLYLVGQLQEAQISASSALPSVEVVERALPPLVRASPSLRLYLALGLALGLLAGACVALVQEQSRPVSGERQLALAAGAPVLHTVPRALAGVSSVVARRPDTHAAESYRALRAALLPAMRRAGAASLAVVSARRREGRTRTAVELAFAMAEAGRRVLLVDGDFSRPSVHARLGIAPGPGLAEALAPGAAGAAAEGWRELVREGGRGEPDVLLAGAPADVGGGARPLERDRGEALARLLADATAGWDVVLFDTPPVLERADGLALAAAAAGALLVCRAGRTPERDVSEAAARLLRAGARTIGAVLNG
jgi:Mrp family chromosome partitioning ATPase